MISPSSRWNRTDLGLQRWKLKRGLGNYSFVLRVSRGFNLVTYESPWCQESHLLWLILWCFSKGTYWSFLEKSNNNFSFVYSFYRSLLKVWGLWGTGQGLSSQNQFLVLHPRPDPRARGVEEGGRRPQDMDWRGRGRPTTGIEKSYTGLPTVSRPKLRTGTVSDRLTATPSENWRDMDPNKDTLLPYFRHVWNIPSTLLSRFFTHIFILAFPFITQELLIKSLPTFFSGRVAVPISVVSYRVLQ